MQREDPIDKEKVNKQLSLLNDLAELVKTGRVDGLILAYSKNNGEEGQERGVTYNIYDDKWGLVGFALAGINSYAMENVGDNEDDE